jgi:hypothetical protein
MRPMAVVDAPAACGHLLAGDRERTPGPARASVRFDMTTASMGEPSCVVCRAVLTMDTAHYANAWERRLKQHPCCSEPCASRFDVDAHWLPAVAPPLVGDDEANRLVQAGKHRVRTGDGPAVVARDLLIAGVPAWMVRNMLVGEGVSAAKTKSTGRLLSVMTVLGGRLWGSTDVRDSNAIAGAHEVIEEWTARFPEQRSERGASP